MTQRPVFLPSVSSKELVTEVYLSLRWHSGFAAVQKKKNILELHASAQMQGLTPILEVSTKSEEKVGQHLSAFNLKVCLQNRQMPIENAFQGSKVFRLAGPFNDLYSAEPSNAKRDSRLQNSGELVCFRIGQIDFPLKPVTAFYDWLYLSAIYPHREWLSRLDGYSGFSDIEFNPQKSVNCQARSCALFVSLRNKGLLDEALSTPTRFLDILRSFSYMQELPYVNQTLGDRKLSSDKPVRHSGLSSPALHPKPIQNESRADDPVDEAFGLWRDHPEDGLAYQERLRREWET